MTKNQAISLMILSKKAEGLSTREAIDAVLGAGTFEQVAGDVYDALRAKWTPESARRRVGGTFGT